ncbi:MFS transporter [Sulfurospirillum barnesii]|uniref:Arabinose efflux permease family protein n=1 Tax=Sulfurospirillum barnesii (strain ATCC 700032 / DSM 10660 / SES-3) TaxID=760154 RepID=I3XY97_SULBS|nr:MFS transporter [Sulfurospirillum barnesii]AFL68921.1 arabinose efflux permease family protein [Sulfurospirillum barnesii SES-3]
MKSSHIPLRHKSLLLNLYVSQYLGLGFFMEALVAILRKSGIPLEQLGLIYFLGLFMIFRFLWAPLIDKVRFKRFGHYRTWLFIWQSLMVLSLLHVSRFDVLTQLQPLLIGCAFFAFFAASQDIAVDALAYKIVLAKDRGMVNALKIGGGLIGMFIGGGLVLIVYEHFGWFYAMLILCAGTATSLVQLLFFKEPHAIYTVKSHEPSWRDFYRFWRGQQKRRWFMLLLAYPVCISGAYGLMTPILVDAGWRLDHIGLNISMFGSLLGIVGAFGAGWLIERFGRRVILIWTPFAQSIGVLFLLLPALGYAHFGFSMLAIGSVMFLYSPSATVLSTLMMDHVEHSPALEYAMQHCVFSFSGILSAGVAMSLAGKFGYINVIVATSLIAVATSLFAWYVSGEVVVKDEQTTHVECIG